MRERISLAQPTYFAYSASDPLRRTPRIFIAFAMLCIKKIINKIRPRVVNPQTLYVVRARVPRILL